MAAGIGSRLRPITDTTPKCLVPIDGRPLLDILSDGLCNAGVTGPCQSAHLPGLVSRHIAERAGPPDVQTFFEPELLGSAGTLAANRSWVDGEEFFLVCNADNLTDFDLHSLIRAHVMHGGVATLTVFHSEQPWSGGVVELDTTGELIGFEEKPSKPVSDLTNAGMYAFHPAILGEIDGPLPQDIGYHLLPRLSRPEPGPCRSMATSATSETATRTCEPARSGPRVMLRDHHPDTAAHRPARGRDRSA